MAGPIVLSAEVDRVSEQIRTLSPETCVATLEAAYTDLERLRPEEVDMADVAANGAGTAQAVFDARLALHEQIRTEQASGALTRDCLRSMRRIDIAGRYLADHLLEALPPESVGDAWLVAPGSGFRGLDDLRSGDVLVTRGGALSSAGIAHMGRIDSQFSHNVLVYVDPDTGERHTVEAYLETGALTQPLDRLLEHGIDRIVVLRHPDAALAARAAEAAYRRVKRGPKIDYDADFDFTHHEGLFCSEVPRWAYGELVGRPDDLPMALALTEFAREDNPSMFAAMGIDQAVTSAPPDILFDPHFDIVAEWRDVSQLPKIRRQDATVESVMHWLEDLGYTLDPEPRHRRLVSFGLTVRRIPLLGAALKHKIHPHGDKDFLVASLALQEVALAVYDDLQTALADRTGEPTYDDLRAELEQLRLADLETWRTDPKKARYHDILRPR